MTDSIDARLLALLEDRLDEQARLALLTEIQDDPELLAQLERASAGLIRIDDAGLGRLGATPAPGQAPLRRGVPAWWLAAAAGLTLMVSVPLTARLAGSEATPLAGASSVTMAESEGSNAGVARGFAATPPAAPDPSYMLVLQGVWPDRDGLDPAEVRARADEYWAFVAALADDGLLVAAGDVRFDGGRRVGSGPPSPLSPAEVRSPDHVVGIVTLRVPSYEAAVDVAARSPHLRYGGTIAVREVGLGFVAVPGMDDWAG